MVEKRQHNYEYEQPTLADDPAFWAPAEEWRMVSAAEISGESSLAQRIGELAQEELDEIDETARQLAQLKSAKPEALETPDVNFVIGEMTGRREQIARLLAEVSLRDPAVRDANEQLLNKLLSEDNK